MSERDTGGHAYPTGRDVTSAGAGMTLRDWFAVHASDEDIKEYRNRNERSGEYALSRTEARYSFADAMLKERNK